MIRRKLKVKFSGKEVRALILSILTLGFVYSFNDWGVELFDARIGIINLIRATILAAMVLITHIYVQKIVAKKYRQEIEYKIWSIEKIPMSLLNAKWSDIKLPFMKIIPLGIVIPLFLAFISNGSWLFLAIASFIFVNNRERVGKPFPFRTDFEEAKIAVSGPMANVLLALVLKLLSLTINLTQAIQMSLLFALFHLLPLPGLSGVKVWFGDRLFYIFCLFLVIFISILLVVLSPLATLLISLIATTVITVFYFYYFELRG